MIKTVRDYVAIHKNMGPLPGIPHQAYYVSLTFFLIADEKVPVYIQALVHELEQRKNTRWIQAPDAIQIENEVEVTLEDDSVGYVTDYDLSDSDGSNDEDVEWDDEE
ncbi:MAG: hypothetical protein GOMPHAMPRED_004380 [Gomphillus americanus]|uniref:Uncharacterized protein n=1 Tax=Gomphillus americanus TaxID=1940652 RepID=A0A8H3IQ70_9LECA|nr:MAG: hypothetical protein GOMPHAMPRED_004380 [Gomphillus americanus]